MDSEPGNTFALIFRIHDQLETKKRDLRTIVDSEFIFIDDINATKVILRAIERVPECYQFLFQDLVDECKKSLAANELALAFRAKQLSDNYSNFEEKLKQEEEFKLKEDFNFTSVLKYEDDIVFSHTVRLPGLSFRFRQGFASFLQQLEQYCCLSKPSDPHRNFAPETRCGGRIITRDHTSNYFFNEQHDLHQAAIHYISAFIEEINALGPLRFPPWARLPLITPTDAELSEAIQGNATVHPDLD